MPVPHSLLAISLWVVSTTALAQFCPPGNPRVALDTRYTVAEPVAGQLIVTDLTTGLTWKRCSEGQTGASCLGAATTHSWTQALTLASSASHAGFTDWRLPNVDELYSLAETGCFGPSINAVVFPATVQLGYWSSTTRATSPGSAWEVVFNGAFINSNAKSISNHVRLVRGGPGRSSFDTGQEILLRDGFE
jgi:hypothetical protein